MTREEIWKDIKGFEGIYQVSSLGSVRSLDRIIKRKNGIPQTLKGKVLSPGINPCGYAFVCLGNMGNSKPYRVHRLVADVFVSNPNNYPVVNHKDENKLNNSVDNLEWCTYSYNTKYNGGMMKRVITRNKKHSYGCEKKVFQYDLKNNLVKVWDSLMSIGRVLGYSYSNIANCCNEIGHRHTAYGYKWSYKPLM